MSVTHPSGRQAAAIVLTSLLLLAAGGDAQGALFDNIRFWVGDDAPNQSRSALVIDWNDGLGPASLAWGYRWDATRTTPTGEDMLLAVAEADNRLFLESGSYAHTVFGLGYDLDGDGFAYVPGPKETGGATDPDDHYQEGWNYSGYWRYYVRSDEMDWSAPSVGMAGRLLADGSWDGWSWSPAPAWNGGPPDDPSPAVVPEPTTLTILSIATVAAAAWPRIRRRLPGPVTR